MKSPGHWLAPLTASLLLAACASPGRAPTAPVAAATAPAGARAVSATPTPTLPPAPGASAPMRTGSAPTAGAASPATAAASPPAPGTPPPFATVIKDATRLEGLVTLWRKDERLWLELRPEDLGRPMFLSPKIATGLGEPPIWGGQMVDDDFALGPQIVEFRRQYNQVQLVARNDAVTVLPDTPEARGVAAAYPPSLLGSGVVASQPEPTTKAVLVDVTGLFASDLMGIGPVLQRSYRQSYGLDARNSAVVGVRNTPELTVIEVRNHYATATIAQPSPGAPASAPAPRTPRFVPDPRSLLIGLHYSLSKLPAQAMAPRRADPRVGYFESTVRDLAEDRARDPRRRWIARWRLDKQDPQAAISPPVKPIVYWLDRSVPLRYRDVIRDGVLAWNEAFLQAGISGAIEVREQPEDADFDTLDTGRASIRWLADGAQRFNAIGPSHVDPRSGEILDADIALQGLSTRSQRALGRQLERSLVTSGFANDGHDHAHDHDHDAPGHRCLIAAHAAEQLGYALEVAEALQPATAGGDTGDERAEQLVRQYLYWVVMHEVGHTLGLRHNFRGSAAPTAAQLDDPAWLAQHGSSASVMDYPALWLPSSGRLGDVTYPSRLGAYDRWAIEYGYASAADDAALQSIASRVQHQQDLAYGTDEDVQIGLDPDAAMFDLGDDALAFAQRRFATARAVLERQDRRRLPSDEDYAALRRAVGYALNDASRAASIAARQIGGLYTRRDFPGNGRDPLQPVPAARQRAALELVLRELLSVDSLPVPPDLRRRLAPDYLERGSAFWDDGASVPTDFPVDRLVFNAQRALLGTLLGDAMAARVLDNAAKTDAGDDVLTLDQLYDRVGRAVWRELASPGGMRTLPAARRELQREHVNQLSALMLRPGAHSRADARSLARREARGLLARLQGARQQAGRLDTVTRAHLDDAAESLRLALAAPMLRTGP